MEENINQILHLNLNVPPLSTRRPFVDPRNESKSNTTNKVPFSWERIPGEPKDKQTNDDTSKIDLLPPPKPPPGWWLPPTPEEINSAMNQCDGDDLGSCDNEYGHDHECFSDAIDIFSLAESIDDTEVNCKAKECRTSATQTPDNGYGSPNFIIRRFLPDARALAEASVMSNKLPFSSSPESNSSFSRAVSIRRSHHSPKGCGLGSFLPWRMRPKPCRVKSPVCDTIIDTNLKQKR